MKSFLQWCDDRRVERVVRILRPHIHGRTLDVGCWNGEVARELSDNIVGIDVTLPPRVAIPASLYDGIRIPYDDGEFDTVLCCTALHHAHDQSTLLGHMKRVGKRIVILEDAFDSWVTRSSVLALHSVGSHFVNFSYYANGFRPLPEWHALFAAHGLRVRHYSRHPGIQPLWFGLRHHLFVLEHGEPARTN